MIPRAGLPERATNQVPRTAHHRDRCHGTTTNEVTHSDESVTSFRVGQVGRKRSAPGRHFLAVATRDRGRRSGQSTRAVASISTSTSGSNR